MRITLMCSGGKRRNKRRGEGEGGREGKEEQVGEKEEGKGWRYDGRRGIS
jgi:hypothetical protein